MIKDVLRFRVKLKHDNSNTIVCKESWTCIEVQLLANSQYTGNTANLNKMLAADIGGNEVVVSC